MNPFADHQVFCEQGIDNLEDMIDLFWEQPFAFATFVYQRYPDLMTDAFAGRIYPIEHQPSPAIAAFRKMLKRTRDYDNGDDYSMPIGSRFHPERAALWDLIPPSGRPRNGWEHGDCQSFVTATNNIRQEVDNFSQKALGNDPHLAKISNQ